MLNLTGFIGPYSRYGRASTVPSSRRLQRSVRTNSWRDIKLGDVWAGARVRVFGLLHFRRLGIIEHVDATNVEILDTENLPSIDDIVDPTFTGGLTAEEFLRRLRDE